MSGAALLMSGPPTPETPFSIYEILFQPIHKRAHHAASKFQTLPSHDRFLASAIAVFPAQFFNSRQTARRRGVSQWSALQRFSDCFGLKGRLEILLPRCAQRQFKPDR